MYLNVKAKTLKLLGGWGNRRKPSGPRAKQHQKGKLINWTSKLKTFSEKDPVKGIKKQVTEWVKDLQMTYLTKDNYLEYIFKKVKTQTNKNIIRK